MTDKIGLSQKNIDYLRSAFAHFFPEDTVYIDEPFSSGNFNWKNRKDFIEFINYRLLKGVVFIESEKDIENIKKAQLEIEKLITEGTEQKIPDPNTLTPKELEELIRKSQQTETEREEIRNEGEKKVKEAITKKEELFQKQKAWEKLQQQKISTLPEQSQEQILLELKEKTIYATPTTPTPVTNLTEKELKLIKILIKIAKNDPETFTQKLSSLIIEKNPDIPLETLEPLSKIIAVETTQTLVNPGNKIVPTGVFVALTNTPKVVKGLEPTTQSEIIKTALIFTALSEEQDNLYRTVLIRSLGGNLTNNVLGPPQREFILTLDSKEGSFVVNLNQLQENSFDFQSNETFQNFLNNPLFSDTQSIVSNELNKFALEKIRSFSGKGVLSEVSNFTTSRAFDSIAPFLGVETSFSYVGKSFFGKTIVKIYPQYAPLITNIAGRLGVDIGIAVVAPVAKEAVVKTGGAVVAKEAVTKVVGKVGLKGVLTKITTALSTAIPIPGINWIIGIIGGELIGKIIEKIPWKKIAKWSAAIIGGVMFLITLPFLGFGKAVFIGFSSAGLSTFFGGNLGGLTFSGVVKKASKITIKAGLSTLKILGLYILATVFGLSVLVALILFIINSGAYIVPYYSEISNITQMGIDDAGGLISRCVVTEKTGSDITEILAREIRNGKVNLLPEFVRGRRDGICITPTMIIMHWSAGTNDNPDGNLRTYETLVARNLSCQLATDTDDVWLMERFFEKQVEFSQCAGEWNTNSISNEMAGRYFTDNPPPPNLDELELAYDATCRIMKQYDIPWSQIYGHYQVPNSGKIDPGKEFLENLFIPEIRRRCPNGY